MNPFSQDKIVSRSTISIGELTNTMYPDFDFDVSISLGNIQRDESWKQSAIEHGLDPYTYHKLLINSMFDNVDIGLITLEIASYTGKYKVIDGKHRIQAIKAYMNNEFPVIRFGTSLYWKDLEIGYQRNFRFITIQVSFTKTGLSELEICELFLAKNVAGVPQSKEHIVQIQNWVEILKNQSQVESAL